MMRHNKIAFRRNRGISLIEILALGLMGIAGLQVVSLRNNDSALKRSFASYLATDMVDRMRLNKTATVTGEYNLTYGASAASGTDVLAKADVVDWLGYMSKTIPNAQGQIESVSSSSQVTVKVRWDDTRTGNYTEFSTSARL